MKIQLINPNTTESMTLSMADSAERVANPGTDLIPRTPKHGPSSIECAFDEALATAAVLDEIAHGERNQVDGHIIACFGDPGIEAAKEIATAPVIGIAGAAFQMASCVSHRFAVVTTMSRTVPMTEALLSHYGVAHQCATIIATDIPVLDLECLADSAYQTLKQACQEAIHTHRAEAIVLGCAGMAPLVAQLQSELGVPIIDGVSAAVKMVESLVTLNLSTSKAGQYQRPYPKSYQGRYQHWNQ
ncbi:MULTISPECIES: aspartate/glutamate racemase family protein [unclassified Vibrio]|uniref:Hydantoin racemase n=1 Tax=Vibrio sp. HB236076 TaxID=3232307 RepID=A0AB39HII6_9VIBR|nr:aspartate/glutamate racemase family protein [Vibrio sp. HB161653]MDP5252820.1 aspartate/glutamate racemase family protein [Vibrio sp. HB161653]